MSLSLLKQWSPGWPRSLKIRPKPITLGRRTTRLTSRERSNPLWIRSSPPFCSSLLYCVECSKACSNTSYHKTTWTRRCATDWSRKPFSFSRSFTSSHASFNWQDFRDPSSSLEVIDYTLPSCGQDFGT